MHSCIHAGGVAVGVSLSAVHQPWEALTIGFSAAVLSAIGFQYLKVLIFLWTKAHRAGHVRLTISLILSFRCICCWYISARIRVTFWARMAYLDSWDGWPICSYRLGTVRITQCKAATVIRQEAKGVTSYLWLRFCFVVQSALQYFTRVPSWLLWP